MWVHVSSAIGTPSLKCFFKVIIGGVVFNHLILHYHCDKVTAEFKYSWSGLPKEMQQKVSAVYILK